MKIPGCLWGSRIVCAPPLAPPRPPPRPPLPGPPRPPGGPPRFWIPPPSKRTSVKEAGGSVSERNYLVLPLVPQSHRRVHRRVLHDLLHLINKGKRAREIIRPEQERTETCLCRRLYRLSLLFLRSQNHHGHLNHLYNNDLAAQRVGRILHGPKPIFCCC